MTVANLLVMQCRVSQHPPPIPSPKNYKPNSPHSTTFFRTFAATFYEGVRSPIKTKQAQMAVKIRLARRGRKKMAMYDIVIAESTSPRDGRLSKKSVRTTPTPTHQRSY